MVQKNIIDMLKMVRKIHPDIIMNDRGTGGIYDFVTPEQRIPTVGLDGYWESNITISEEKAKLEWPEWKLCF